MNDLQTIKAPGFDLELAIRKGLLRNTDRHAAGCFLRYLDQKGYSPVDPEGWGEYARSLDQPVRIKNRLGRSKLSAGGYNNRIQAARKLLRCMIENDGRLDSAHQAQLLHLAEANLPRKKDRRTSLPTERYVTREELLTMIEAAKRPTWGLARNRARPDLALWLEFLWTTGARISEATGIMIGEVRPVDASTAKILLHGKGGLDREVYAPRELIDRIRAWFMGDEYLFQSRDPRTGGRFSRQHISGLVHRAAVNCLGRGFGAHALRHGFATHALEKGTNIFNLSQYLGHRSLNTTAAYYLHSKVDPHQLLGAMGLN